MKTMIMAAVATMSLGIGVAFAAGGPVGYDTPVYGSKAFSDHSKDAQVQFLGQGTVLGKMFNRASDTNRITVNAPTKG
jgi:hypothetical protein